MLEGLLEFRRSCAPYRTAEILKAEKGALQFLLLGALGVELHDGRRRGQDQRQQYQRHHELDQRKAA